MSAESLLAYKLTDSTDSPGHEDVYIWGKPSFLLPYCLSIIKMSLLSCVPIYYIHPLPAPDQPLASILPVGKSAPLHWTHGLSLCSASSLPPFWNHCPPSVPRASSGVFLLRAFSWHFLSLPCCPHAIPACPTASLPSDP